MIPVKLNNVHLDVLTFNNLIISCLHDLNLSNNDAGLPFCEFMTFDVLSYLKDDDSFSPYASNIRELSHYGSKMTSKEVCHPCKIATQCPFYIKIIITLFILIYGKSYI